MKILRSTEMEKTQSETSKRSLSTLSALMRWISIELKLKLVKENPEMIETFFCLLRVSILGKCLTSDMKF